MSIYTQKKKHDSEGAGSLIEFPAEEYPAMKSPILVELPLSLSVKSKSSHKE
jgi:hypothetical protein